MSEQQTPTPLTYERILELFHETREQFRLNDLRFQERMDRMSQEAELRKQEAELRSQKLERQMKETDDKISALGSRIGEIVENMIGGDIVGQFQALGYAVTAYSRNKKFGIKGTSASGEIDLLLEDGDVVILIEAKTALKTADVLDHIDRLEKYRSEINKNGNMDRRKLIGAIAGAVADANVIKFAQSHGLYAIVQSGKGVEIVTLPEGFQARKW
jgi:hypothetical protein